MKQEIEIHHTRAEGRRIYVDYTIYEDFPQLDGTVVESTTNVHGQEIPMYNLIEFVKEEELNWQYIIAPDVITELDPVTYLFENMDDVCKLYIESKLERVEI